MKGERDILNEYSANAQIREDLPVIDFLESLDNNKKYTYLEVGAGTGRFPLKLRDDLGIKNLNITCIEINKDLAHNLRTKNLNVKEEDIRKMPFDDNHFDIVHCSHVIEHFGYPDIASVLDELLRVAKKDGYVIIRSPLMHSGFYNDIDHIRPYTHKTILQYFNNPQQQKVGAYKIKLVKIWYRKQAKEFKSSMRGIWRLNFILKSLWNRFNWPKAKANGYIAIFKKI